MDKKLKQDWIKALCSHREKSMTQTINNKVEMWWCDDGQFCIAVNNKINEVTATLTRLEAFALGHSILDPARPETDWRDIDTAPKDGTHILAYRLPLGIRFTNLTNPPTVVHWFDDPCAPGFYTSVNSIEPEHSFDPTHWMPLPDPPKMESP